MSREKFLLKWITKNKSVKKFKVLPFLHEKKREPYDSRFQLVLLEFLIKELLQLQQSVPTNKLLFRVNLCDLTQLRKGPPDLFVVCLATKKWGHKWLYRKTYILIFLFYFCYFIHCNYYFCSFIYCFTSFYALF